MTIQKSTMFSEGTSENDSSLQTKSFKMNYTFYEESDSRFYNDYKMTKAFAEKCNDPKTVQAVWISFYVELLKSCDAVTYMYVHLAETEDGELDVAIYDYSASPEEMFVNKIEVLEDEIVVRGETINTDAYPLDKIKIKRMEELIK